MRLESIKYSVIIILSLIYFEKSDAQFQVSTYFDVGSNNVSEGLFLNSAGIGNYTFGENKIELGAQLNLISPYAPLFSGTNMTYSRNISIKNFEFELKALFLYEKFAMDLHEFDWGLIFCKTYDHFKFSLGTSFRTYLITADESSGTDNTLHENWNTIYSASYFLNPSDKDWNLGITLSNIDYFLINQETNPIINIHANYKISEPFLIYAEAWYKSSGALNLSVNYFGFFFRTGLIWKIDI